MCPPCTTSQHLAGVTGLVGVGRRPRRLRVSSGCCWVHGLRNSAARPRLHRSTQSELPGRSRSLRWSTGRVFFDIPTGDSLAPVAALAWWTIAARSEAHFLSLIAALAAQPRTHVGRFSLALVCLLRRRRLKHPRRCDSSTSGGAGEEVRTERGHLPSRSWKRPSFSRRLNSSAPASLVAAPRRRERNLAGTALTFARFAHVWRRSLGTTQRESCCWPGSQSATSSTNIGQAYSPRARRCPGIGGCLELAAGVRSRSRVECASRLCARMGWAIAFGPRPQMCTTSASISALCRSRARTPSCHRSWRRPHH